MAKSPKSISFRLGLFVGFAVLIALVVTFRIGRNIRPAPDESTNSRPKDEFSREAQTKDDPRLPLLLSEIITGIQNTNSPAAVRGQLAELRDFLQTLPPRTAATQIQDFLNSKTNASTGLPFKIGARGFLADAPTLRVFLLDYLAQIDPAAAADYSRIILANMDSPDEWAIALRNYAKGNSTAEGRSFIEEKLRAMLTYEAWVAEPSEGFLESFDVPVHLGGTNLIPALAELVRMKDNQAVAHAAYLALDRMTITDAATTLAMLEANPFLMQGREITEANFFARADVGQPAQRQLLEEFLLRPTLDPAALEKFAGLYPNANFMVSHNLLTRVVSLDGAKLEARDAEALRVVQLWLGDPRFAGLKAQLERVQRRLEVYVPQAGRGQ